MSSAIFEGPLVVLGRVGLGRRRRAPDLDIEGDRLHSTTTRQPQIGARHGDLAGGLALLGRPFGVERGGDRGAAQIAVQHPKVGRLQLERIGKSLVRIDVDIALEREPALGRVARREPLDDEPVALAHQCHRDVAQDDAAQRIGEATVRDVELAGHQRPGDRAAELEIDRQIALDDLAVQGRQRHQRLEAALGGDLSVEWQRLRQVEREGLQRELHRQPEVQRDRAITETVDARAA